jgi:SAM-dependent methyltransferase
MKNILHRFKRKLTKSLALLSATSPKTMQSAVHQCRQTPLRAVVWLDLIQLVRDQLPEADRLLVVSHRLGREGVVLSYAPELEIKLKDSFVAASEKLRLNNAAEIASGVIGELVRWKTIIQCRDTHATGNYFSDAEKYMAWQWDNIIYPIVKDADFSEVLEIAPGHGRNTHYLSQLSRKIHLVDVNESCVAACRKRFGTKHNNCEFVYHITDGNSLGGIENDSITFVYTFDSMVHFDKIVVADYVKEIARILKPNGTAFLHHSNFGAFQPDSDWAHNTVTRSDMSAELMREYAAVAGLLVDYQRLSGRADGWGTDELDCFTVLRQTGPREAAE